MINTGILYWMRNKKQAKSRKMKFSYKSFEEAKKKGFAGARMCSRSFLQLVVFTKYIITLSLFSNPLLLYISVIDFKSFFVLLLFLDRLCVI